MKYILFILTLPLPLLAGNFMSHDCDDWHLIESWSGDDDFYNQDWHCLNCNAWNEGSRFRCWKCKEYRED